jgi:hypothetical protein
MVGPPRSYVGQGPKSKNDISSVVEYLVPSISAPMVKVMPCSVLKYSGQHDQFKLCSKLWYKFMLHSE